MDTNFYGLSTLLENNEQKIDNYRQNGRIRRNAIGCEARAIAILH